VGTTLWVVAAVLVAWAVLDPLTGNAFNAPTVSPAGRAALTLVPPWAVYRVWAEMLEYAARAARRGGRGLEWGDVSGPAADAQGGLGAALGCLLVEWPLLVLAALLLDWVVPALRSLHCPHHVPELATSHPCILISPFQCLRWMPPFLKISLQRLAVPVPCIYVSTPLFKASRKRPM
jgi:hypothetical protein